MSQSASPTSNAPSRADALKHRKLLIASVFGSSIEWYDFFLYGTAAALVFPHVFFPANSPLTGTLLSFATFWAGFIARPIGGVLAGHFGDTYGRKPVVVVTLLAMGVATFVTGCLPGADAIGVVAPIALVICRFVQGLSAGGQWGGFTLLLTESAGPKHRGFSGSFVQLGAPVGALLGNLAFLCGTWALGPDQFYSWGWRIPFWFTAVLFPIAIYIHNRIEDSPEFRALQATSTAASQASTTTVTRTPLLTALRDHWKTIVLGCFTLAGTHTIFFVSIAGILNYGTEHLGMNRTHMLLAAMVMCAISAITAPLFGAWSDRIGRRPVMILGGAGIALWAPIYFWLVGTGNMALFTLALAVAGVFQPMIFAPVATFLAELFAPNVRFSAASMSYQLAAVVISGGTPMIMASLIALTGDTRGVTAFIVCAGLITVLSTLLLPETNTAAIRKNPEAVPGEQLHHT